MARINKELVVLVGRDRENPRTHREAFEITDGLGEILDKHIKRNNLNKSEFIREAVAAKLEAEMQNEPLIKDEKIRKAVRAWAEANEIVKAFIVMNEHMNWTVYGDDVDRNRFSIEFFDRVVFEKDETKNYTITELCGEEEE